MADERGNTGHWNTGNRNTGHWNTGHWNTGHWNTGFFCTQTPKAMFFDQPTDLSFEDARDLIPFVDLPIGVEFVPSDDLTDAEKAEHPNHETIGGYLRKRELPIQEAFPKVWAKMDDATKQRFMDLPNFDAEKFRECTGVDVREDRPRVKVRTVDGEVVEVYAEEHKGA